MFCPNCKGKLPAYGTRKDMICPFCGGNVRKEDALEELVYTGEIETKNANDCTNEKRADGVIIGHLPENPENEPSKRKNDRSFNSKNRQTNTKKSDQKKRSKQNSIDWNLLIILLFCSVLILGPLSLLLIFNPSDSDESKEKDHDYSEEVSVVSSEDYEIFYSIPNDGFTYLSFDIDYQSNLVFAKYGIILSVDNRKVATISNGSRFTGIIKVDPGNHFIRFSGDDNDKRHVIDRKINVDHSILFSCKLESHIKNISIIDDSVSDTSCKMINVVGFNLENALKRLYEKGFSNIFLSGTNIDEITKDEYGDYFVVEQSIKPDELILLDREITLFLESKYVEESFGEVSKGETSESTESSSQTSSEEESKDAKKEKQAKEESKEESKQEESQKSGQTSEREKYDVDKDLVVISMTPSTKYTSQYKIVFAEKDNSGAIVRLYMFDAIDNCINPRDMGKLFNAWGDFPSWFYVGATVHVKAKLSQEDLLYSCTVTEAETKEEPIDVSGYVMKGTDMETIKMILKDNNITKYCGAEDWKNGVRREQYENANGSIAVELVYYQNSDALLCAEVMTNSLASATQQQEIIIALSKCLCPLNDCVKVQDWVKTNISNGQTCKIMIGGYTYEIRIGLANNLYYSAGVIELENNYLQWVH